MQGPSTISLGNEGSGDSSTNSVQYEAAIGNDGCCNGSPLNRHYLLSLLSKYRKVLVNKHLRCLGHGARQYLGSMQQSCLGGGEKALHAVV